MLEIEHHLNTADSHTMHTHVYRMNKMHISTITRSCVAKLLCTHKYNGLQCNTRNLFSYNSSTFIIDSANACNMQVLPPYIFVETKNNK